MSLPHLILGILKYGPSTGYDLNKAFQASVYHFWNTEQSQIYKALYKLHESGWLEVERVTQEDRPDKKVYSLTETGQGELHRWLSAPQPLTAIHDAWIGQLFFGAAMDKSELETLLQTRIDHLKAILAIFENELPINGLQYAEQFNAFADLPFWQLTMQYGIEKYKFDLAWAERALQTLQNLS